MSNYWCFVFMVDEKLTAATQTEPVPTLIDRMPLDVPADVHTAVGADAVLAMQSSADPSVTEVLLLNWSLYSTE